MKEVKYNPKHINRYNYLFHWNSINTILNNHELYLKGKYSLPYPITIEIDPIDICNHKCIWCFTNIHRRISSLDTSLLDNLLNDLKDSCTISIHFSGGGEPTLYTDLFRDIHGNSIIQKYMNHFTMGLITNGSIIHTMDTKYITKGLKWIRFSIDAGTDSHYNYIHKPASNTLCDVHNNISNIIKQRNDSIYPVVGCSFIYDRFDNDILKEIRLFVENMSSFGIDYVQIKPENNFSPFTTQHIINSIKNTINPILINSNTFATIDAPYKINDTSDFCWYSYFGPAIGASGGIYSCCSKYGQDDYNYGYITNTCGFNEIWNSNKRINIVKGIKPSACKSCRHAIFNNEINKLYKIKQKDRDHLSSIMELLKEGYSINRVNIPQSLLFLKRGLTHYQTILKYGYNRLLDYPVYRETYIIGV